MSQVTICLRDAELRPSKAAAMTSKQMGAVDANGYPPDFFEQIRANADAWADFPTLEEIRATEAV